MVNGKLELLDKAVKDREKRLAELKEDLDKVVIPVYKIDLRIEQQLKVLERLEKEKQDALDKVRDIFELAIVNSHSLSNGYEVRFHGMRPIKITNMQSFMKWLKANIPATEVSTFLEAAITRKELQKFIVNYCDTQRLKGVINPTVDGIDIQEITFRRLRTSTNKQERKK